MNVAPPTRWRLAIVLLIGALLRLPALQHELISDDEAIYDAMARVIRHGGVMYHDTVDHKPPGLAYTYAAVESLAREDRAQLMLVHLLGMLAALATALGLFAVARLMLPVSLTLWPPLLYLVISTAKQPADALAVNGELLMNVPSIFGVWAALAATRTSAKRRLVLDVVAGALVGIATLYKYQAGVTIIALGVLFVCRPIRLKEVALRIGACAFGFVLPLVAVAGYFHARGALGDALQWGIMFNRHYIAQHSTFTWVLRRFAFQVVGVLLPGGLLYWGASRGLQGIVRGDAYASADIVDGHAFLVAWCALATAVVGLGGRFFGHYFLQAELPLSLAAAGPVAQLFRRAPRWCVVSLAAPALVFAVIATVPSWSDRCFEANAPDYEHIGAAVASRTHPDETIWVWGNAPQLYYAAHRRPGVRFSFCNYLTGLSPAMPSEYDPKLDPRSDAIQSAWQLVVEDLDRMKPVLVLDTAAARMKHYGKFPIRSFPTLSAYLSAHYRPEGEVSGVRFYRRIN
jgi:hypothetical protein